MLPPLRALELLRAGGRVGALQGAAAGQTLRAGLLLHVCDDDGIRGQGEASPLPGYSPDTIEDCERELAAVPVAGLSPREDEPACEWIARAFAAGRVRSPAARFALESALLDWLGRRRGVSVAALLAGTGVATRRVPLAALPGDMSSARAAYARGIRTFKLKVASDTWAEDLHFAQSLREAFGDGVRLRFDANGRLPSEEAMPRLAELVRFAPEYVEEPVPTADFMRLAGAPVPLAADESLAQPGAWPALADVCRVIVLKPTLLGGLCTCLALAREAEARGLAVAVTHTFDGPVALAAAAELAAALPGRVLACGLDSHAGLAAWPEVAIPQLAACDAGSANAPGLGMPLLELA